MRGFSATHLTTLVSVGLVAFAFLAWSGRIEPGVVNDAAKTLVALAAWFVGWVMQRPSFAAPKEPPQ